MKIQNWIACVQGRGKWKEVAEKTRISTKKFSAWKKKKKKKKKGVFVLTQNCLCFLPKCINRPGNYGT